ncbi:MAG: hypothetical protein WC781_03120 [Candidatus Pacearchaeota archaeon]|jgi:hypothetical protein
MELENKTKLERFLEPVDEYAVLVIARENRQGLNGNSSWNRFCYAIANGLYLVAGEIAKDNDYPRQILSRVSEFSACERIL